MGPEYGYALPLISAGSHDLQHDFRPMRRLARLCHNPENPQRNHEHARLLE